jgi:hypothetical protein
MAAPFPHFMAGVPGPAMHPPILAGFAPAVAPAPLAAAPLAMTSPYVPFLHQPMALQTMPQVVPISVAGQPLSKLFNIKPH